MLIYLLLFALLVGLPDNLLLKFRGMIFVLGVFMSDLVVLSYFSVWI